jgi:hypothetical protein
MLPDQPYVTTYDCASAPDHRRLVNNKALFALWILLLFVVSYAAFYPGLLNADSVDQLSQSLTHHYRDWHSPLMSAVWSLLNRIHVGPSPMLLLEQATFYVALFIFASITFQRSWLACVWATALVLYPPIFNLLGLVTCDGFYVPIVFLGYALALKSLEDHSTPGKWLNLLSQAFLVISTAVRREGMIAAAAALFVLDLSLIRGILPQPRLFALRITVLSFCCVVITLATSTIGIYLFNYQLMDARKTFPYQPTLLYDLMALSARDHNDFVPDAFNPAALTIADLEHRFDPATGDSFIFDGTKRTLVLSYDPTSAQELRRAWRIEVGEHWRQYISDRLTFALYLLGIRTASLPRSQFISEQRTFGYFKDLRDVHAMFEPNGITRFYANVSQATFGWPIYMGWSYCLISLACLFLHGSLLSYEKAHAPMALVGAALAAGGLMQTAMLIFVAPTPLFRYLDWPMLASILSLTLAVRLCAEISGFRGVWSSASKRSPI